ncbi:P-loop NTPase fold protein [Reichenbachiella sp.]|uniref:KAP family P-loop NTPase fold protein n=1 Tax=Reichenbachiella sp. TaxID=2184521 RepID=UPI003297F439
MATSFYKTRKKLFSSGGKYFFDDEPVNENKPDELGYGTYAEEIAERLENTDSNKSFAIGINGQWGFGKTSFINLIKMKLHKEDKFILDFNPWGAESPETIVNDFFDNLQERIRPTYASLANRLVKYSNKLSAISKNPITKSLELIQSIKDIGSSGSLDLYEEINDEINRLNKKIIVFVDDLDRLNTAELLSVIRLIRNTANFNNTFFVVAYDRNYVLEAIKEHNSFNHHLFLEKIFQIEINLPSFMNEILGGELIKKIKSITPVIVHKDVSETILGTRVFRPAYFYHWISNLRDVTRLANAVSINFSNLQGEVDFSNFFHLEMLRLKFPSVYELLFRKTQDFLQTQPDGYNKNIYCLRTKKNYRVNNYDVRNLKEYEIYDYLELNHCQQSIPKYDIEKIVGLLDGIFSNQFGSRRNPLSVVYPSNFNKYFSYSLGDKDLSEVEFSEYRRKTLQEFKEKINDWVKNGKEQELKKKFEEVHSFDNEQDFKKIILGIFHLANQRTQTQMELRRIVGFDALNLNNKLGDYEYLRNEESVSDTDSKNNLSKFILSIFDNAKSPFSFESAFIAEILKQYHINFPIEEKVLEARLVTYLKQYCSSVQNIDMHVWHLFECCRVAKWESSNDGSHKSVPIRIAEAKQILKQFVIEKNAETILPPLINPGRLKKGRYQLFSNNILAVWDDWKSFYDYINDIEESPFILEFKEFYRKLEEVSFNEFVEFNFKEIKLPKNDVGISPQ